LTTNYKEDFLLIIIYRYLDDVALHHLIDALCKLSAESIYQNKPNIQVSNCCLTPSQQCSGQEPVPF
jgi:hypothetical protein